MSEHLPLIMLPGMGADARMFLAQQMAFPQLQVATWVTPEPRESLAHYAGRMVEQLSPGPECFLGGASFGGVVALEMACLIHPRACILIGSMRDADGLPTYFRRLKCMSGLIRCAPAVAQLGLWTVGSVLGAVNRGVLRQLSEADGRFLSWAIRALLDWNPSPGTLHLTIAQIHGGRDRLLPLRLTHPDQELPGAGHLLSITHAKDVNDFIRCRIVEAGGTGVGP